MVLVIYVITNFTFHTLKRSFFDVSVKWSCFYYCAICINNKAVYTYLYC